ncbi:MAG: efflux RND transporter periplasmic adaptor subunit, partial [Nitrospirota bacterium]|nr:efflux RND transporter periplasmic adaptor subunit [Nitrospirota bacterium]
YTTIITPVTGLSSKAKQQDGSYISASNSLLTYVAQLDPIWVNFSVSENQNLNLRDQINKGLLTIPKGYNYQVEVELADGSIYPFKGRVSFADPSFSTETGTFLVRATFANPKGNLRPGQFVRVHLKGAIRPKAILVPQRAVMQGAKGHFVWVVNKESKAEIRDVQVGDWHGNDWFITKGLSTGDSVVVDGAIKLSAGLPVKIAEPGQKQSQNTDTKSPGAPAKGHPDEASAPAKK